MPRELTAEEQPYDGCPESWHETNGETLQRVDEWIAEGHPSRCRTRLGEIVKKDSFRFSTTTNRLLAHCISHHEATVDDIEAVMQEAVAYGWKEVGLLEAVHVRQEPLVGQLLVQADVLAKQPAGVWTLRLLIASIDEEQFSAIWDFSWTPRFAERHQEWMNALMFTALHRNLRLDDALRRISEDTLATYDICGSDLVSRFTHSPVLAEHRDTLLERLLDERGLGAAKHIVHACRSFRQEEQPPTALVRATRMLVEEDPESAEAESGLGQSLWVDPAFAMPIAAKWINDSERGLSYNSDFSWRITRADQNRLMAALAEDALAYPEAHHEILAGCVPLRDIAPEAVCAWIEGNLDREEARFYIAGLLSRYLSQQPEQAVLENMINQAERLHEQHGVRNRDRVLRRNHLNQDGVEPRLRAIALAQDIRPLPDPPDVKQALANLRGLPATFKALGEGQLERLLHRESDDFVVLHLFEEDLAAQWKQNEREWKDKEINEYWYNWCRHRLAYAARFRTLWEERFRRLLDAGYNLRSKGLRLKAEDWTEVMLLDRLRGQFDEVIYEPKAKDFPETQGKVLDFLVRCPDGEAFVELGVIGEKPNDVLEGVRRSLGGEGIKKTLQNKLQGQFRDGDVDLKRPAVVAVQTRMPWDLDWETNNALYGPKKLAWTRDNERGQIVAEGTTRDVEWAFFEEDGVECISGVVVIAAEELGSEYLTGHLCKPLRTPTYPLPLKVWVRLRTALFGPDPPDLEKNLGAIPTITTDETGLLWDAGLDDVSFLAAGRYKRPEDLGIGEDRFAELQAEAMRLVRIHCHQQIRLLRAAEGAELQPFYDAGIHTLDQLLATEQPPEGVDDALWFAMHNEAKGFRS